MNEIVEIFIDVEHLDLEASDEHPKNGAYLPQDPPIPATAASGDGHQCRACGKGYSSKGSLRYHRKLKHPNGEIPQKCAVCNKECTSVLSCRRHMQYMHSDEHHCKVCYKVFPTLEMLLAHNESCCACKVSCPKCRKVCNSKVALRNHLRYKHPDGMRHGCDICGRAFSSRMKLSNHKVGIHPPGGIMCFQCGKTFPSPRSVYSHMMGKHAAGGERCIRCNKVFAKKAALHKHCAKQHSFQFVSAPLSG